MSIASVSPVTGETIKSFGPMTDDEVVAAIERAHARWTTYRTTSFAKRAGWLRQAAGLLRGDKQVIARVMTTEMGKTLGASLAEVEKCAQAFDHFAANSEGVLSRQPVDAESVGAAKAFVTFEPLGVVVAVMPWNFPLWQVVRFAAPALMAGNVCLLKHASNVPQTALLLEDVLRRAGLPESCFQTLLATSGQVEGVLRHELVAAATLTGSEPAGRAVAAICGDEVKPSVLELGGSDPFVVMPSADLPRAVDAAVASRVQNNGQTCVAAKRFIVHEEIYDQFARLFTEQMKALRIGDPMDADTEIGPLATEQGRADIESLVADAVAKGAATLCGGSTPEGPGWFYPPTVLADITDEMRIHTEEAFGPVATLYRVRDIDEALEVANSTTFGLGSNAWTDDPAEQDAFMAGFEAGQVFVNGMTASYFDLPFGGIKRSGYGRELSTYGLRAFCNVKTVWIGA